MATILAVGIATLDIINHVDHYPHEDEEMRVLSQRRCRGGNATNTLTVLSQLGHQCAWSGVLIDEPDTALITQDLDDYRVDYQLARRYPQGKMPTSYITINQQTGSRTIVHYRDCPELDFAHFQQLPLADFDWIHFEGRAVPELKLMLDWLKQQHPTIRRSLEVEKPRSGIETVFADVDVLMFSQNYAFSTGAKSAAEFLHKQTGSAIATCTWGAEGAWLKHDQQLYHSAAYPPAKVVDTLGAGDTFNAGLISALSQQHTVNDALTFACQLAGKKCGQAGFDKLNGL